MFGQPAGGVSGPGMRLLLFNSPIFSVTSGIEYIGRFTSETDAMVTANCPFCHDAVLRSLSGGVNEFPPRLQVDSNRFERENQFLTTEIFSSSLFRAASNKVSKRKEGCGYEKLPDIFHCSHVAAARGSTESSNRPTPHNRLTSLTVGSCIDSCIDSCEEHRHVCVSQEQSEL
jgi:hypothetical protein